MSMLYVKETGATFADTPEGAAEAAAHAQEVANRLGRTVDVHRAEEAEVAPLTHDEASRIANDVWGDVFRVDRLDPRGDVEGDPVVTVWKVSLHSSTGPVHFITQLGSGRIIVGSRAGWEEYVPSGLPPAGSSLLAEGQPHERPYRLFLWDVERPAWYLDRRYSRLADAEIAFREACERDDPAILVDVDAPGNKILRRCNDEGLPELPFIMQTGARTGLGERGTARLPAGWTLDSAESFWASVGGTMSGCIARMERDSNVDDPSAFCGNIQQALIEGGRKRRGEEADGLTPEQARALLRYRDVNGRQWKNNLLVDWQRARYDSVSDEDASLLQQVRNNLGPSWLNRVTLGDIRAAAGQAQDHSAAETLSPLFAIEIDASQGVPDDYPHGARFRPDLDELARQELAVGRTSRRPPDAQYRAIEWTGARGTVGRLLDWLDEQPGITRWGELFVEEADGGLRLQPHGAEDAEEGRWRKAQFRSDGGVIDGHAYNLRGTNLHGSVIKQDSNWCWEIASGMSPLGSGCEDTLTKAKAVVEAELDKLDRKRRGRGASEHSDEAAEEGRGTFVIVGDDGRFWDGTGFTNEYPDAKIYKRWNAVVEAAMAIAAPVRAIKNYGYEDEEVVWPFEAEEGRRKKGPVEGTRGQFCVTTWQERDRLNISLWRRFDPLDDCTDGTLVADWWDEDARQMFEDGFFRGGLSRRALGTSAPSPELTASVIEYMESVGIIRVLEDEEATA